MCVTLCRTNHSSTSPVPAGKTHREYDSRRCVRSGPLTCCFFSIGTNVRIPGHALLLQGLIKTMAEGAKESWCQSAISRLTVTESSILFCNRFWKVPISPYLVSGILGRILHMKSLMLLALPLLFVPSLQNAQSEKEFSIRPDLSKSENISKWDLDGTGVWSIGSGRLILSKAGIPAGPIRRPGALAILKMKPLRS